MPKTLAAIILTLAALAAGGMTPVRAEGAGSWCYRDFNAAPGGNCRFHSANDCMISVSAMGGICERNHALQRHPRAPVKIRKRIRVRR
jgi:hypothetical protein